MSGAKGIESEVLVTDFLLKLKVSQITDVHRLLYESTVLEAKNVREAINLAKAPTAEDIMIIFKKILPLGLSQKALAARLGVTTGTLSRWVSGENPPREFVRGPIVQELGRVVDHIVARLEAYREHQNFKRLRRTAVPALVKRGPR
jgi:transcriptional regulator with XRE-family HTH domain